MIINNKINKLQNRTRKKRELDRAAVLQRTVREGFSEDVIPEQRPKQIMAMGCVFTTSHLRGVTHSKPGCGRGLDILKLTEV